MMKLVVIPVVAIVLVAGMFLFPSEDRAEANDSPAIVAMVDPPPVDGTWPSTVFAGSTVAVPFLGFRTGDVSEELAHHLGLKAEMGVMIKEVVAGTHASEAGLKVYDVILTVNGQGATPSVLNEALEEETGLELGVVRGGLLHHIAVPVDRTAKAGTPSEGSFFSTDELGAEHPFRKLESASALRRSYTTKVNLYSQKIDELRDSEKQERGLARKEVEALQAKCMAEVAEYTQARETELLLHVDSQFRARSVAPLEALQLDFEKLVPPADGEAIRGAIAATRTMLQKELPDFALPESVDRQLTNSVRQRVQQIGGRTGQLYAERLDQCFSSHASEVQRHRDRIDKKYGQRMSWATKSVDKIQEQLRKRVTCAFKRVREEFGQKLHHRLRKMEAPKPGEIRGCMTEVRSQIDRMGHRFIRRTGQALDEFEKQIASANRKLEQACSVHSGGQRKAYDRLTRDLLAIANSDRGIEITDTTEYGEARSELTDACDRLEDALRKAVNRGRDATRAHRLPLGRAFRDHGTVTDHAWRDLERSLGRICQEISNDCWKLDGPHLDGRHPREGKNARPKMDLASLMR